jgi:hypothetical protein
VHQFEIIDGTNLTPEELFELIKDPMEQAAKKHGTQKPLSEETYELGEAVEVQWDTSWVRGIITNKDVPVRVQIDGQQESVERANDQVRKLKK